MALSGIVFDIDNFLIDFREVRDTALLMALGKNCSHLKLKDIF